MLLVEQQVRHALGVSDRADVLRRGRAGAPFHEGLDEFGIDVAIVDTTAGL